MQKCAQDELKVRKKGHSLPENDIEQSLTRYLDRGRQNVRHVVKERAV